jgi:hypothetical protein
VSKCRGLEQRRARSAPDRRAARRPEPGAQPCARVVKLSRPSWRSACFMVSYVAGPISSRHSFSTDAMDCDAGFGYTRTCNALLRSLRCLGERGFAFLCRRRPQRGSTWPSAVNWHVHHHVDMPTRRCLGACQTPTPLPRSRSNQVPQPALEPAPLTTHRTCGMTVSCLGRGSGAAGCDACRRQAALITQIATADREGPVVNRPCWR